MKILSCIWKNSTNIILQLYLDMKDLKEKLFMSYLLDYFLTIV